MLLRAEPLTGVDSWPMTRTDHRPSAILRGAVLTDPNLVKD